MNKKTIAQRVLEQYRNVRQIDPNSTFNCVAWSLRFDSTFTDQDLFTLHDIIFDPVNSYQNDVRSVMIRYGDCGPVSMLEVVLIKSDDSYQIKMIAYSIVDLHTTDSRDAIRKVLKQDDVVITRVKWIRK